MDKLQTEFDITSLLNVDNEVDYEVNGYLDVKYAGNKTLKNHRSKLKICIKSYHEKIWINLTLDFKFESACSRCLSENMLTKQNNFEIGFYKDDENDYDIDLNAEIIDVTPLISEVILNEMKLQYLCKLECKGLCSDCGKNQNIKVCKHPKKNLKESPFSSLTELDL